MSSYTKQYTIDWINKQSDASKIWEYLRTTNPPDGFIYSRHPIVQRILIGTDDELMHSGASFGCTMRGVQNYAIEQGKKDKKIKTELFGEKAQKNMDNNNKKAAKVMMEKGPEEFVKHVFTDQKSGKQLSYSQMRSLYG